MIGMMGYGGMAAAWQQIRYAPNLARSAGVAPAATEQSRPSAVSAAAVPVAASAALTPSELPYVPAGYGPEELAARARVQYTGLGAPSSEEEANAFGQEEEKVFGQEETNAFGQEETKIFGNEEAKAFGQEEKKVFGQEEEDEEEQEGVAGVKDAKSPAEVTEDAKCQTCEKRKYKDGSDDPGVSFKNAQRVDPRLAQAAVRGHEMEHVVRERAKAEREGRKVVSQSVTYHTGICPECGKFYVSGGTTRTVTAEDNSSEYLDDLLGLDDGKGKVFDITA